MAKRRKKRLRVAVVGLRGIGRAHVRAIRSLKDECELAAVCDVVPQQAKESAEEYGVPGYISLKEMLATEKLDFVTVGTPHPFHAEVAVACAKAGVHCLVEKPIASTVADARRIIAACRRAGTKLGVVFQFRFVPAFRKARELLDAGVIGPLRRAVLEYTCSRTDVYYGLSPWRGTWRGEGGGVLLNQAPHYLDLFVWLTGGLPVEVTARCDAFLHDIEVEDRVDALLRYADGASAHIHLSSCESPGTERLALHGDKGALILEGTTLRVARLDGSFTRFIRTSKKAFAAPKVKWETYPELKGDGLVHRPVVADFIRACRTPKGRPAVSGEDAARSLELANALTCSSVRGRPVKLPLSARAYSELLDELIRKAEKKKAGGKKKKARK